MAQTTTMSPLNAIGMDLGDYKSVVAFLHEDDSVRTVTVRTTPDDVLVLFDRIPRGVTIFFEVGSCSRWIKAILEGQGHRTHVADARKVPRTGPKKSDKEDAISLARLGRADPELLGEVHHRGHAAQLVMAKLRVREALVGNRTKLVNGVRGILKSFGFRLRNCSTATIHNRLQDVPEELRTIVAPALQTTGQMSATIKQIDRDLATIAKTQFPETEQLRQVSGVGPITALSFILVVEDPGRFRRNRDIGAYLGLTPKLHESGTLRPQLGISKAGDSTMRRLLVTAAHAVLRSNAPPSDLKRHGQAITERGGGNAKKRAVVAVARKLAVLLLALWKNDEPYDPDRHEVKLEGDAFMGKPRTDEVLAGAN